MALEYRLWYEALDRDFYEVNSVRDFILDFEDGEKYKFPVYFFVDILGYFYIELQIPIFNIGEGYLDLSLMIDGQPKQRLSTLSSFKLLLCRMISLLVPNPEIHLENENFREDYFFSLNDISQEITVDNFITQLTLIVERLKKTYWKNYKNLENLHIILWKLILLYGFDLFVLQLFCDDNYSYNSKKVKRLEEFDKNEIDFIEFGEALLLSESAYFIHINCPGLIMACMANRYFNTKKKHKFKVKKEETNYEVLRNQALEFFKSVFGKK